MEPQKWISLTESLLREITTDKNNIREFYLTKIKHQKIKTQINYLVCLKNLFKITGKNNQKLLEKADILNLLESKWFDSLKPSTRKLYIIRFVDYLKFSKRKDLVVYFPKKIKIEQRYFNKNELVSRDDLNLLLENVSPKLKALIIVLYEGALRKGELLNIKLEDIVFSDKFAEIEIRKSKTKKRRIPLIESIPYLREWIKEIGIKEDDIVFQYKSESSLNSTFNSINSYMKKRHPNKWKHNKLYPHLFRHSRLTELAASGYSNEALLKKFAGWTPGSNMAAVYFHLDDADTKNMILIENGLEKFENKPIKKLQPIICPTCNMENGQQNYFCYNCNNLLDKKKSTEAGLHLIIQPDEIAEINKRLTNNEKVIEMLTKLLFHKYRINSYQDLEVGNSGDFTDLIIGEFNKLIDKE